MLIFRIASQSKASLPAELSLAQLLFSVDPIWSKAYRFQLRREDLPTQ